MSLPEGKPGAFESLASYYDMNGSECLNESDDNPFANCLKVGGVSYKLTHNAANNKGLANWPGANRWNFF